MSHKPTGRPNGRPIYQARIRDGSHECWHICPTCPRGHRDWSHDLNQVQADQGYMDKWIRKCPQCRKEGNYVPAVHQAVEGTVS